MAKLMLLLLVSLFVASQSSIDNSTEKRKPRNFDNLYGDFPNDYNQESSGKPVYSDAPPSKIQQETPKPSNDRIKEYDPYFPSYPAVYKGYPYYLKDGSQRVTPAQMTEMIAAMKELQDSKDDGQQGILSKIISDPKSILVAAIIPVSIMLASFIPLLMNYFMTGSNSLPPVLTATAGNKSGRSFNETTAFLESLLQGLAEFRGKATEEDGCVEKAVCLFFDQHSAGGDYVRRSAKVVASTVQPDWFGESRIASILVGLKQGDCSNVCGKDEQRPKKGDF